MSTQTLFHVLNLPSGTWTIELNIPRATPQATAEDVARSSVPADPWWEHAGTQIIKGVHR